MAQKEYRNWFRTRVCLLVHLCGFVFAMSLFAFTYYQRLTDYNQNLFVAISRQSRFQTSQIERQYLDNVVQLSQEVALVAEGVPQNPSDFSEQQWTHDALPQQLEDYMLDEPFVSLNQYLNSAVEQLQYTPNDPSNGIASEYLVHAYVVMQAPEFNRSHVVRVLTDSRYPILSSEVRLWPGKYLRGADASVAYDELFAGKPLYTVDFKDSSHIVSGIPVRDGSNQVVAAALFEYNTRPNQILFVQATGRLAIFYLLGYLLYSGLSILIVVVVCRPIAALKRNALSVMGGETSSRNYLNTRDELAVIGRGADHLAELLHKRDLEIEKIQSIHRNLIPTQLLEYFHKKSIGELSVGEYTERYINILSIIVEYPERIHTGYSSPQEIIGSINFNLAFIGEIVEHHGGFIEYVSEFAIGALFPDSADSPLDATIEIHKRLLIVNEQNAKQNKEPINLYIGVHRGSTAVGMVGYSKYLKTVVVSNALSISNQIARIASRIGAATLISEATFRNIYNSLNYQTRYIGRVPLGITNAIQLYDLIDVYDDDLMKLIIATKIDFIDAIGSFEQGQYRKAQEILKVLLATNRDDKVASYFVNHVAGYINAGSTTRRSKSIIST